MTVEVVSNVRAVLDDRIAEDASIGYEDGIIIALEEGRSYRGAVDGRGTLCLPGLVDSHCDTLEREISPRPGVFFDADFALRALEGRFLAAGVTTVLHGAHFGETVGGRSVQMAMDMTAAIEHRRLSPLAPLEHRALYRIGARHAAGLEEALTVLHRGQAPGAVPLLSFEDHTPGQGQYRDIGRFRSMVAAERSLGPQEVDALLAERLAVAKAAEPTKVANREKLAALAAGGAVRALAHDADDAEAVTAAHEWGASVAEFPVTIEAARRARELGMPVVMGAPNVLRGASHSGNASAEETIAAGHCTCLASDYLPASLLAAVFVLVDKGLCTLPGAVRLVTRGPAEVLEADDRGRLEPGWRADFVLVEMDGKWPTVRAVQSAGNTPSAGAPELRRIA